MASSFSSFITSCDYFGHQIQLRFNPNKAKVMRTTHNTILGGFISVLVWILLVAYTLDLTDKLWNNLEDRNVTYETAVEHQNKTITLLDSKMRFFVSIINKKTLLPVPLTNEALFKFVRIQAYTLHWNWLSVPPKLERQYVAMRECQGADWGSDPDMKE